MAEPFLRIDYDSGVPVYRQIVDTIAARIAGGMLQPDTPLPTIHELANQLEINPNTVAKAYRELEHLGLATAERGKGTFPRKPRGKAIPKTAALDKIVRAALEAAENYGIARAELKAFLLERL